MENKMSKFKIPVTWSVSGFVEVHAGNLEDAIRKAKDAPMPKDGEYIDDSFQVDTEALYDSLDENPNMVKIVHKPNQLD